MEALQKEKRHLESELEAVSRKTHDASGQLVVISQELLKKERSLNELRVLLLEANRHSPGPERDLSREVHKAEWRIKEQKLKDDIRGLREKLTGLVCGEGWSGGRGIPRWGCSFHAIRSWRVVTSWSYPRNSQAAEKVQNPPEPQGQ